MSKKLDKDEFLKRLNKGFYSSPKSAKQALSRADIKWGKGVKASLHKAIEKHTFGAKRVLKKGKTNKSKVRTFTPLDLLISFLELDAKARRAVLDILSFVVTSEMPLQELLDIFAESNERLRAK